MEPSNSGFAAAPGDSLQLGILDLGKRAPGETAAQVLRGSLELARQAEQWGYNRYWVGEHHTPDTAQAAPEILIGLIAVSTTHLKVGSGGVLLRYYSPLKVAESFLMLEALFPGRIELGVCKGPGVTSPHVALTLASGNIIELTEEAYERKVQDVTRYYRETSGSDVPGTPNVPQPYPLGVLPPPVWVLGGSEKSMRMAAQGGNPYAHTLFTSPKADRTHESLATYYEQFASYHPALAPRSTLAVSVVCLESQSKAEQRHREMVEQGCLPSNVVGSPDNCAEQLQEIARQYATGQLLVTTWLGNPAERRGLYGLLAEACQTPTRTAPALALA